MIKFQQDQPYYSFELANNNANIRRTRQRVEELKREADGKQQEIQQKNSMTVLFCVRMPKIAGFSLFLTVSRTIKRAHY